MTAPNLPPPNESPAEPSIVDAEAAAALRASANEMRQCAVAMMGNRPVVHREAPIVPHAAKSPAPEETTETDVLLFPDWVRSDYATGTASRSPDGTFALECIYGESGNRDTYRHEDYQHVAFASLVFLPGGSVRVVLHTGAFKMTRINFVNNRATEADILAGDPNFRDPSTYNWPARLAAMVTNVDYQHEQHVELTICPDSTIIFHKAVSSDLGEGHPYGTEPEVRHHPTTADFAETVLGRVRYLLQPLVDSTDIRTFAAARREPRQIPLP